MKITITFSDFAMTIDTDDEPPARLGTRLNEYLSEYLDELIDEPRPEGTRVELPTPTPPVRAAKRNKAPPPTNGALEAAPQPPPKAKANALFSSVAEPEKRRLGFDEFDKLVRAEMVRLASAPGVMPTHEAWNKGRNKLLPNLMDIVVRYQCLTTAQLAVKLGMEPAPMGRPKSAEPVTVYTTEEEESL